MRAKNIGKVVSMITLLFLTGVIPVYAQQEDTSRIEFDLDQQVDFKPELRIPETSLPIRLFPKKLERYRLDDNGLKLNLYRKFDHFDRRKTFDFQKGNLGPSGLKWKRQINNDLQLYTKEILSEEDEIPKVLAFIASFIQLDLFEPYEVPIVPRFKSGTTPIIENRINREVSN